MPDRDDTESEDLQRQLAALQASHPDLEPLAALVLLAVRQFGEGRDARGVTTSLLSRKLGIEHALVRRAAADLEAAGFVAAVPAGGASPALRLTLVVPA
ncbi:MarR family transcriptional regulator [Salinicola avicenniae]|uniref:MarR family transcriptional regulator n=1 Tax=Salinicola avicenniae TaxID=2916836 RepID=UPI002072E9AF|nr:MULTISPECIES: MarR family transcriptional regulator [unclassified Salinicola]